MDKETYLTFLLGREYFAVNVKKVLEVLEQQTITPVPQAPDHILGILNFRGEILPVVDTRRKFNLKALDSQSKYYVIVYEIGDNENKTTIASTADAVKDVIEIAEEEIKPVPEIGINYDNKYISGAIRREETFTLLVNIEKVLSKADVESIN